MSDKGISVNGGKAKNTGLIVLWLAVLVGTALASPEADWTVNLENLMGRTARFGLLGIGVAFVIVTGGIDLSLGSLVGLLGTLLPMWMVARGYSGWLVVPALLALAAGLGWLHGSLVVRGRLQPFVVTLCGLLVYRGVARMWGNDRPQGWGLEPNGLRDLANGSDLNLALVAGCVLLVVYAVGRLGARAGGRLGALLGLGLLAYGLAGRWLEWPQGPRVPNAFGLMTLVALGAWVLLERSVFGRHLLALGQNEEAARYAGLPTGRLITWAYVICSLCTGLAGLLFALKQSAVPPASQGNFFELYAIAAAVLGGCSLRGGEGSILGVVVGTALLRTLLNAIHLLGLDQKLEFAILGGVILAGVMADEFVRRAVTRRRLRAQTLD